MRTLTLPCLLLFLLCGCGASNAPGPSGKSAKLYSYDFVRDVKAGEKLDMSMLRPLEIVANTVTGVDIKDIVLTSAEVKDFVGKPLKTNVKKGDILDKGLF